jgi:hypothetical protein
MPARCSPQMSGHFEYHAFARRCTCKKCMTWIRACGELERYRFFKLHKMEAIQSHQKVNPSMPAAHLHLDATSSHLSRENNDCAPTRPPEFRLPRFDLSCTLILTSFMSSSVQRMVRMAHHETTHELAELLRGSALRLGCRIG